MKIKGKLWPGWCGECKNDKRTPCYVIRHKGGDGHFPCDFLRKFLYKNEEITIKENICKKRK